MSNRNRGEKNTEEFSPIENLSSPNTGADKADPWSINSIFGDQPEDIFSAGDKGVS